jgi:hypothetical protein
VATILTARPDSQDVVLRIADVIRARVADLNSE